MAATPATDITAVVSGTSLTGGADAGANTAQVSTITPGSDVAVGNVYTVTINGISVSYTATAATVANVTAGLAAAINGNTTINKIVTAADHTSYITATAVTAGTAGAFTISASATKGSHSTEGATIQTKLTVTATGAVSNTSVSKTATGQTLTLATGQLSSPTLISTSPVTQFVVSGSKQNVASYNFVSKIGGVTINEMKFTTDSNKTITSVSINGQSASVVDNVADVSGLGISVPASYAGVDVPVSVTYNKVGLNGLSGDNLTSTLTLTYVKYTSGNTTSELKPSVPAHNMQLVASKPSVTLVDSSDTLSAGKEVKLASVKVSANSAGRVELAALPISVSSAGATTITSQTVSVKVSGQTVSGATTTLTVGTGSTGTSTIVFSSPYAIPAGESVTFDIYTTTDSYTAGTAGQDSLSTKLGSSADFKWNDVNAGAAGNGLTGEYIFNYPTNTSVIHN